MKKVIIGKFWLNEQDSFEPTGIRFRKDNVPNCLYDLADVLEEQFGVKKEDGKYPSNTKELKITIEEVTTIRRNEMYIIKKINQLLEGLDLE